MNTPKTPNLTITEPLASAESRDPFGLSALPGLQPAEDGWAAVAASLQEHGNQQRQQRRHWISGLAVAATVALAFGLVVLLPTPSERPPAEQALNELASVDQNPQAEAAVEIAGERPDPNTGVQDLQDLQTLQRLSQRLEQNLVYLRSSVGAMPAEMVVYQVELEDLVAQVDAAISQQPDVSELWQQRVNLLMDLNEVYGEGLRRDDPYVASL